MAALSLTHSFIKSQAPITPNRAAMKTQTCVTCRSSKKPVGSSETNNKKKMGEKEDKRLGEGWRSGQRGDWKDLVLMSLSFAVYVYISEKIVCAYCLWMSMPKQF